jgi:ATP-dependent DNA helicase RecG
MKVAEGDLIEQIEEALAFVKRHISMAAEITDLERKERWEYPLDAVREAVVNAVCHRDYASTGNVQVRVFDHGLEVWNPGGLPPGLSAADLRKSHESKPRSKLIARVFFLARYIEQFGTGTRRMIDDCLAAGLPEPEFDSRPDAFRVAFRKSVPVEERVADLGLSDRQLRAVHRVVERGRITRREYERLTATTAVTAKRDLSDLVSKGVFTKRGATRNIWYELAGSELGPNDPKMTRMTGAASGQRGRLPMSTKPLCCAPTR